MITLKQTSKQNCSFCGAFSTQVCVIYTFAGTKTVNLCNHSECRALVTKSVALELLNPQQPSKYLVPQDETSGVSAIFGTWPGDESDEE